MKATLLCLCIVSLFTNSGFSQTAQKQEMQKRTDSIPKPHTEKTLFTQPTLVPATAVNSKPKTETTTGTHTNLVPASEINSKPKTETAAGSQVNLVPVSKSDPKPATVPPAPNKSGASLLDAFVTVSTGYSLQTFPVTSGYNKDPDTHWSCGIFDQNGRPVTSFHDDSNSDEYGEGSVTGPLQMHIDNAAVFGDFTNGGRLHINIAPNGNDTWGITQFVLVIDFQNPSLSQKITWPGFNLSQDKRDIDLYFRYDGNNLVVRQ